VTGLKGQAKSEKKRGKRILIDSSLRKNFVEKNRPENAGNGAEIAKKRGELQSRGRKKDDEGYTRGGGTSLGISTIESARTERREKKRPK